MSKTSKVENCEEIKILTYMKMMSLVLTSFLQICICRNDDSNTYFKMVHKDSQMEQLEFTSNPV